MIRRGPGARPRPAGRTVTPRDRSADLPPLALDPVPASPAEALALAVAWADDNAGHGAGRALVKVAFRAILGGVPGLHRADVQARLHGVDALGAYLAPAPELADEDDQAPF